MVYRIPTQTIVLLNCTSSQTLSTTLTHFFSALGILRDAWLAIEQSIRVYFDARRKSSMKPFPHLKVIHYDSEYAFHGRLVFRI